MDRPRPTTDGRRLLSPLRDFIATESAGAVLIAVAAVVALLWANSPWSASYDSFWSSRIAFEVAGHTLDLDLRHWVNDGLMTVFFLVVGLEIKRELTDGHLANRRAAMLPIAGAFGGMLMPACLYLAVAGGSAPRGWAVPVATDIALAVGVLAVAGPLLAPSLRAFLLGLAIVDDIGAIVIIAAFYSSGVRWAWLLVALAGVALVVVVRRVALQLTWVYVAIGIVVWFAFHEAGVHATLAGVAMGLLAPTEPHLAPEYVDVEELTDLTSIEAARSSVLIARRSVSEVELLQHVLHPWTSYLIVPVFALANAGITLSLDGIGDAATSRVAWGVLLGLLLGKPIGVLAAVAISTRLGLAEAPAGASRRQLLGVAVAAGIGFTVALFITELAFVDEVLLEQAKLAVFAASVLAAVVAAVTLRRSPSPAVPA